MDVKQRGGKNKVNERKRKEDRNGKRMEEKINIEIDRQTDK